MSVNRQLEAGQRLLQAGKAGEAAEILKKALGETSSHPHLLLYAGLASVVSGDVSDGLALIEAAAVADPGNHLLPFFYGRALYDSGAFSAANEACDRVLEAQPGHPGAIALRFLCEGETNALAGLTGLSLAGLPDDAEIRGRALALAERILLQEHREIARLWPAGRRPWDVHSGLSGAYSSDLPRQSKRWWIKRSHWLLMETGGYERSIVAAEAAMREQPTDEIRVLLATRYFEAGRYSEVEAALRDFLPQDPERNTWVGFSLYEMGYPEQALLTLENAETDSAIAIHARGLALLALGRLTDARDSFIQAARLDSNLVETRVARAYLRARADALESAEAQSTEQERESVVITALAETPNANDDAETSAGSDAPAPE